MTQQTSGSLFIISAPSGAGKSSLVKALLAADQQVALSISHTTREPRGQEQHGREYFFTSDAEFDALIQQNALLEWAAVHGQRYGTSKQAVAQQLASGQDVILEIDYQGAFQVQQQLPQAQLIFILPPSMNELRARIERRGEDAPEKIALRMHTALADVAEAGKFDFVIINDRFEAALADLHSIVAAQRLRAAIQRQRHAALFAAMHIQ